MDRSSLAPGVVAEMKKLSRKYVLYTTKGKIWSVSDGIFALCSAWNIATDPAREMTPAEYSAAQRYARAIRGRMDRLGYRLDEHYTEADDGRLSPIFRDAA